LWNGAPLALAAFLGLAYQQADKLLTNRLIGDAETGYLTAAFVIIFGLVEVLNTTVMTAVFPLLSRSHGDGRNPMFGFMVEKLGFFNVLIMLPIALIVSIFAADLTVPLFGEDFHPTADVLRILIWYALFQMVTSTLTYGFMVQNRQRRYLLIRALGLGVNILLLVVLLPLLGVTGAAVASVCAETAVMLVLFFRFQAAGWNRQALIPRALRLGLLGLITAGVMVLVGQIHPILGGAVGLAVFAAGIPILGILAADDWDLLYRMAAAMPGGGIILKYWRRDVKLNW
jgi:O-antigen/teichoic acid export membrane protein